MIPLHKSLSQYALDNTYVKAYDVTIMKQLTTLTASEAREDLYTLIKTVSNGLRSYEINLRGANPVVLISKSEIESWLETLDILSSPEEMKAINESKKDKRVFSHADVFKKLGLRDGNNL